MMLYSHDYDSNYLPSMPVAEILIGPSKRMPTMRLTALIDSGADGTIIPIRFLDEIGARKGERGWLRGISIHRIPVDVYLISLQLGSIRPAVMRVAATHYEEALIGRDLLNQYIVTLNGLASVMEIAD